MPRPELQGRPFARRVATGTAQRRQKGAIACERVRLWTTQANVHGEVVGEGRTKDLKICKSILRTTEPRLGLKVKRHSIKML